MVIKKALDLFFSNPADVPFMSLSAGHHQGHRRSNKHYKHPLNTGVVAVALRAKSVTRESTSTTSANFFVQKVKLTFRFKKKGKKKKP